MHLYASLYQFIDAHIVHFALGIVAYVVGRVHAAVNYAKAKAQEIESQVKKVV